MLGFYDKLQNTKEKYLDMVANEARKYDNVIIYGAGRAAYPVVSYLKQQQIKIAVFAVSDASINEKEYMGIPVKQIEDIRLSSDMTLIVIAVKSIWGGQVLEKVKANGYMNYILPPKELDYFARERSDEVDRPVMEITVKAGCKVNCRYCPQELFIKRYFENIDRAEYLSLENYKICLNKLPKDTIIDFCGFAEPFLNPQAVDMMEYTYGKGYDMRLYTTLVGLTKEDLVRIWNIPFRYVVLHTPDEQEFARIPVSAEYFEMLDMLLGHHKPNGTNFIDTANCQGTPHSEVVKHTQGKLRIMSQLYDRAGNLKDKKVFQRIDWINGNIFCSRVNRKLDYNVMLPDGTVVLCNFDFGIRHILGNLLNESYEEIINGNNMQKIVEALDNDRCDLLCRKCNFAVSTCDSSL